MDYREAADRIEQHMIVHHMDGYPRANKITEALSMAVGLLRAADRDQSGAAKLESMRSRKPIPGRRLEVDWDEVPHPGGFH